MSSSSHKILKITAALITAVCTSAQASEVTELEEVVVTASRTEEAVSDTLAPVTVITRQQIERSQASSVTELLKQAPGVQVTTNGGNGSLPGVYLRGTKTAQTLVLVDGQKINSPSSGVPPLQYLDPAEIERIEIVRGPRSSLYGADAIGGVIQIFTRQGEGKPSLSVRLGGGNMNTDEYGISFGGEVGSTRFRLGGNVYSTEGYDFTLTEMNGDDDNDAYENGTLSGSISSRFSEKLEIGANFLYSEGRSEYDNNYDDFTYTTQPYNDFTVINAGTFTNFQVSDAWSGRLEVGYAEEQADAKNEDFVTGNVSDNYHSTIQRYSASLKNDIEWQQIHLLTAGVDFSDETYEGSTTYLVDSRYNAGVFVQNRTEVGSQELQLAVRTDSNEAYGYHTTGSAQYGLYLREDMRFTASFGTAFRAPTLGDLYYPGYDNPDLKPETSQNIEVGLDGTIRWADWSLALYQNEMDNMIALDCNYTPINIAEALLQGIEVTLNSSISDWSINTAVSFLNPENRSGKHSGNVLVYRAKQLLNVDLDRQLGSLGIGATFRAQGKSYADAENSEVVAGFGTVDLRASYKITRDLRVGGKVVNLLDKEYMTVDGYREEPLSVFATLEWKVL